MNLLDTDDISILFKNLVLLPEDKHDLQNNIGKANVRSYESSSELSEKTTALTNESKPVYKAEPIKILIPKNLHDAYLKDGSAFMKILTSMKLKKLVNHITHEVPDKENLLKNDCVWAIGWDISTEKKIISSDHPNLLVSQEILKLSIKEDKLAMFLPLKEFINKNTETISKLN